MTFNNQLKKICFVIPDGTGIRNYLYSELVELLHQKKCEIVIVHSISTNAIEEIKRVHNFNFESFKLPIYVETPFQKLLRETVCYARLLHNEKLVKNRTILENWKPNKSNFKKKIFYKLVEYIGSFLSHNYQRILKVEEKHKKLVTNSSTKQQKLLKKINPAVIFSTHQRAIQALPFLNAAHELGIETIGAIFSWDNLPKARLSLKTTKYVVWSNYMKEELKLYYPEIKENSISITGTSQFEFYAKEEFRMEKELFYSTYGLDVAKKIICFSGDDMLTSPFDPNYLEDIAEVIFKTKLNIQILLRRAPVDVSGRFDAVVLKYPDIIKVAAPMWNFDKDNTSNWQIIYPTFEDIGLLVSTAYYCDAVFNVGSTMAHDFAMFNKPAIYLNYNPVESTTWNIETIYKFQHFKSMEGLHPVVWLNSKNEINTIFKDLSKNLHLDNNEWINRIAEHRKTASLNIAKIVISCT